MLNLSESQGRGVFFDSVLQLSLQRGVLDRKQGNVEGNSVRRLMEKPW